MYKTLKYVLFFGILVGLMACGNDSTGPDPSEAPSFPEIQNEEAQPDVSFFENNEPKTLAKTTDNYYSARNVALFQGSLTFAIGSMYSGFLMAGNEDDASYEDGMWVWEYSYQYENESVSFKLTAEEVPGGHEWAMYWSFDDGETSVEDYNVMEGFVSDDGSEGDWTLNSLNSDTNEEEVAFTSEWTITSDTESSMTVETFDSGTTTMTASYDRDEPEHTMTFTEPDDPNITLYWNTNTNTGYYQEDGQKQCWDENFEDTPC